MKIYYVFFLLIFFLGCRSKEQKQLHDNIQELKDNAQAILEELGKANRVLDSLHERDGLIMKTIESDTKLMNKLKQYAHITNIKQLKPRC
jgi:hypothetical protein